MTECKEANFLHAIPGNFTKRCSALDIVRSVLVSCPGNTRTKSGDLLQDRIGGSGPDERPPRTIVVLDEGVDFPHQVLDAGERTTANGALSDETEPAFHLVEPRRIGRCVVHVIAGPL